jgi:hypothetical protein
LPPFKNVTDVEMYKEKVEINKVYDDDPNMVREGKIFTLLALENNL